MIQIAQTHSKRSGLLRALLMILLPLILASLACTAPGVGGGGASLQETDIALGIQQTFIAQTSVALAAAPPTAVPTQPPVVPTQPQQQNPPTPTLPPPTEVPTAAPPPTQAPTPAPDKIKITEWGMQFWAYLSSGCRTSGEPCWKADDEYNRHLGMSDMIMVSKNPIKIDANWSNPHLVFYHRYNIKRDARIDIQRDATWITVRDMTKKNSGTTWVHEVINLRDFKGSEIKVRLSAGGIWGSGGIPPTQWFVTEVYVVPDYKP